MFLVIPFVEFLHVLGVDINVHHENPATFLGHMSVSSVKSSRHRFAPGPHAWRPGETRDTNWGAILADIPRFRGCCARSSVSSRHAAMKFARNQPRSQPIVRVARLEAICMRLPSNRPLTRPALAQLDGP